MIDSRTVFEIHALQNAGYSTRRISSQLGIHRDSVRKYLNNPDVTPKRKPRVSKLDEYRPWVDQALEKDPKVSEMVVFQHLQKMGFQGKSTIVNDYLKQKRDQVKKQAFIRFESEPGEQMQIDWAHFGTLEYGQTSRKLYALAVIECYSRRMYMEFTHSQQQEVVHQCLLFVLMEIFTQHLPGVSRKSLF